MYDYLKRIFDLTVSVFGLVTLLIPFVIISAFIKMSSNGTVFHRSQRVGKSGRKFEMIKFRTMYEETPVRPFESFRLPEKYYENFGKFLRTTAIDELPQLINVLKGEMSLVGPRPSLDNHFDLIALRNRHGIYEIRPGLTGYAQINGRGRLSSEEKTELDRYYLENMSLRFDLTILLKTIPFLIEDMMGSE
ncbi:MAG: sugar transferase [Ignavibacteria bacterium]|nr:sugar transferase [Ignavibacteria bacterium]